jgi:hypothetical protein
MVSMFPTVHLNGTSRGELQTQLETALGALRSAIESLQDAAPHGRDYYVQGPLAYELATVEHVNRLTKLKAVAEDLQALLEHVAQ